MALPSKPLFLYSDFTKTPHEIIVDLINYCNGTSLASESLTYGEPSPITGNHNTVIEITANQQSSYIGTASITYNRVDLADFFQGQILEVAIIADSAAQISDVIPLINSSYGLNLTPDDYIDGPLPDSSGYGIDVALPFVLQANPKSLIFVGEVSFSAVHLPVEIDELHHLVTVTLPSPGYFAR